MTRHDELLAEAVLREVRGLTTRQAVLRLFELGLVSRRGCEQRAIRDEIGRLEKEGMSPLRSLRGHSREILLLLREGAQRILQHLQTLIMKSEIQINNTAGVCQIDIEGTIGVPEEWQFEEPDARVATYERFRDTLRRIAEIEAPEVVVNIRSTGGDVNDALLIHDALRQLPARVTTRCYGYTASAATIIAQAASEGCRLLSANALYLIHTAICSTEGNAAEIAGKIDLLHQTDARIAAVYASRSGRPAAEFEALMAENNGNGRWLAPEEAVAAGLADKVVEAAEQPASSLARNIARGWERLLANIGLRPGPALPADRNVLHFDGEVQALRSRSAVAADEARRQAAPTSTQPREDPSCGDTVRSANERAYAEDARRMRN